MQGSLKGRSVTFRTRRRQATIWSTITALGFTSLAPSPTWPFQVALLVAQVALGKFTVKTATVVELPQTLAWPGAIGPESAQVWMLAPFPTAISVQPDRSTVSVPALAISMKRSVR